MKKKYQFWLAESSALQVWKRKYSVIFVIKIHSFTSVVLANVFSLLKCLSHVWRFCIFIIARFPWAKLQYILSCKNVVFMYFFGVKVGDFEKWPGKKMTGQKKWRQSRNAWKHRNMNYIAKCQGSFEIHSIFYKPVFGIVSK